MISPHTLVRLQRRHVVPIQWTIDGAAAAAAADAMLRQFMLVVFAEKGVAIVAV
jgi:hypothetical protein